MARAAGVEINLLAARCDGFALGGLLACLIVAGRQRAAGMATVAALAGGVASLAWVAWSTDSAPLLDYRPANVNAATLLSFALVALAAKHAGGRHTAWLRSRGLAFLGTISYGLYLYHYPIILRSYSLTMRLGIHGTAAEPFALAALSLAVAVLSWHAIEQPILRLKGRFPYPEASPVGVGAEWPAPPGCLIGEPEG